MSSFGSNFSDNGSIAPHSLPRYYDTLLSTRSPESLAYLSFFPNSSSASRPSPGAGDGRNSLAVSLDGSPVGRLGVRGAGGSNEGGGIQHRDTNRLPTPAGLSPPPHPPAGPPHGDEAATAECSDTSFASKNASMGCLSGRTAGNYSMAGHQYTHTGNTFHNFDYNNNASWSDTVGSNNASITSLNNKLLSTAAARETNGSNRTTASNQHAAPLPIAFLPVSPGHAPHPHSNTATPTTAKNGGVGSHPHSLGSSLSLSLPPASPLTKHRNCGTAIDDHTFMNAFPTTNVIALSADNTSTPISQRTQQQTKASSPLTVGSPTHSSSSPTGSRVPFPFAAERVTIFYEHYAPAKLFQEEPTVDNGSMVKWSSKETESIYFFEQNEKSRQVRYFMQKFEGKEGQLLFALQRKYDGSEAVAMQAKATFLFTTAEQYHAEMLSWCAKYVGEAIEAYLVEHFSRKNKSDSCHSSSMQASTNSVWSHDALSRHQNLSHVSPYSLESPSTLEYAVSPPPLPSSPHTNPPSPASTCEDGQPSSIAAIASNINVLSSLLQELSVASSHAQTHLVCSVRQHVFDHALRPVEECLQHYCGRLITLREICRSVRNTRFVKRPQDSSSSPHLTTGRTGLFSQVVPGQRQSPPTVSPVNRRPVVIPVLVQPASEAAACTNSPTTSSSLSASFHSNSFFAPPIADSPQTLPSSNATTNQEQNNNTRAAATGDSSAGSSLGKAAEKTSIGKITAAEVQNEITASIEKLEAHLERITSTRRLDGNQTVTNSISNSDDGSTHDVVSIGEMIMKQAQRLLDQHQMVYERCQNRQ